MCVTHSIEWIPAANKPVLAMVNNMTKYGIIVVEALSLDQLTGWPTLVREPYHECASVHLPWLQWLPWR